jgi:flagellar biosynthesis protein FlhF
VPEDWHRLSANALVHRALRASSGSAYKLDANDVSLIFTAPMGATKAPRTHGSSLHA